MRELLDRAVRTRTAPRRRGGASRDEFDVMVVGAGFAGSVVAERLASQDGATVLVVDRRPHVAGNAYDHFDDAGVLVHRYGPHIFHTNSREVFSYLGEFTKWRPYQHRVLASVDGQLLPMPINLDTVNRLYGLQLTAFELDDFFASVAEQRQPVRTMEDAVVSKVGRDLYLKFFRNYTRKQWDLDPSELDASIAAWGSDADEPRRPVLHRHLPGDAAARLHADVREHALAPADQDPAQHRLPRGRALRPVPAHGLHRPDRRVLRLPVREAPVPLARVPVRDV